MPHVTFVRVAFMTAAFAAAAHDAWGQITPLQCPTRPGLVGGPGTIVGTVSDSGRVPLDSVEVFITSAKRQTLSAGGDFRLDKLQSGQYVVTAHRLGYLQQIRRVTLGDSGAVV